MAIQICSSQQQEREVAMVNYAGNVGSEFNKEEIKSGGTSRLKLRLMDRNLYPFFNSCGKSIFPPDANTYTVIPCIFCVFFNTVTNGHLFLET